MESGMLWRRCKSFHGPSRGGYQVLGRGSIAAMRNPQQRLRDHMMLVHSQRPEPVLVRQTAAVFRPGSTYYDVLFCIQGRPFSDYATTSPCSSVQLSQSHYIKYMSSFPILLCSNVCTKIVFHLKLQQYSNIHHPLPCFQCPPVALAMTYRYFFLVTSSHPSLSRSLNRYMKIVKEKRVL